MKPVITQDNIICGNCKLQFERKSELKFCSNCFACTGCEIYYCPRCDQEIVVIPIRRMKQHSGKKIKK